MKYIIPLFCIAFSILLYTCNTTVQQNYQAFPVSAHLNPKVEGFEVQTITKGEGEWLSITTDPQGRLLVSPRHGILLRFTVKDDMANALTVDTLDVGVTDCQGLLYAYQSLYMMGSQDTIRGVYRLPDLDGKGNFGKPVLLKEFPENGDHTGHTLTLGPDGMIYFLTGNENLVPGEPNESYVTTNWQTDHLMPVTTIFAPHQGPPGGFVMRTDSLGQHWQFYAYGLRNPYDMCFSSEGELFTFDSDMEWDFNLPWYRATRVNHLVSGGDYAWREGTAKRFDYYPDVWPAVQDIGRGSPTATVFGTGAAFPEKYQRALFLGDWSYGKIYAMHLQKDGASYTAEYEPFVTGQPLNITDMIVGQDGAIYFVTGGNGTDTGLFRIVYKGEESTKPVASDAAQATETEDLVGLRRSLEDWHFSNEPEGLQMALDYVGHEDRWIRNAARVILERHDPATWQSALSEAKSFDAKTTLLLALIRMDSLGIYQGQVLEQLRSYPNASLTETQRLGVLRLWGLAFLRNEGLSDKDCAGAYDLLLPLYPAESAVENKELSRLLSYLAVRKGDGAEVIARTIPLLESTKDQLQFLHYLEVLRQIPDGWTTEQRLAYQYWMNFAKENMTGGSLFTYFLNEIEREFTTTLSRKEKRRMRKNDPKPLDASAVGPVKPRPKARVASNVFEGERTVTNWTMEDLQYSLELVSSPRSRRLRSTNRGERMFALGQCYDCHYMLGKGGNFGPELTLAGNSFSAEDLLTAIIHPSQAINSRFQGTDFTLREDGFISGRLVGEEGNSLLVQIGFDPANTERIPKSNVLSEEPAKVSEMPAGLINTMNREEVLDLLYFIIQAAAKGQGEPELDIFEEKSIMETGDSCLVEIINYAGKGEVYYTLDGARPEPSDVLYDGPFYINSGAVIQAKVFDGVDTSEMKQRVVHMVDREFNGLNWKLFNNVTEPFENPPKGKADANGVAYTFDIGNIVQEQNNFLLEFEGFLQVEQTGTYDFYSLQDDAMQLYLDGQLVIDRTGERTRRPGTGSIGLEAGLHPIRVLFYEGMGSEFLQIEYEGPGINRQVIPGGALWRERDNS